MLAPDLQTQRLTLRAPKAGDFPAYAAFYASDRATIIGGPLTDAEAWHKFASMAGHWALNGFGWFMVEDADGACGFVGVHQPPHYPDMELGWVLYGGHEGQGYATEAAAEVRRWTRATLAPPRLVSFIDPANSNSQRVARRLGATTDGTRAAHDPDCEVWMHPLGAAA